MITLPTLIQRAANGAPLSIAQGDSNWQEILRFCTALNSQISSAIQDNGVLNLYAHDAGVVNAYQITPATPISSYIDGRFFLFKALNTNTGASTLSVGTAAGAFLAATPIRIAGADLPAGAINAGEVVAVVYDLADLAFNLITGGASTAVSAGVASTVIGATTTDSAVNLQNFAPASVPIPLSQATGSLRCTSSSAPPDNSTVTIQGKIYTFKTTLDAVNGHVKSETSMAVSLQHLADAINHGAVAGNAAYVGAGTLSHLAQMIANTGTVAAGTAIAVTAAEYPYITTGSTQLVVTACEAGTGGNAITTTTSFTTQGAWVGGTLANGLARVTIPFAHGFASTPDGVKVSLTCINNTLGEVNFTAGRAVAASSFFTATNQPGLSYTADDTYINVAMTNDVIYVGDPVTGLPVMVMPSHWMLNVSGYVVNGIATFSPDPADLQGPVSTMTFAHGLLSPTVNVGLLNISPEFGYAEGGVTPIEQFSDATGHPAFTVTVDDTNIYVAENCPGSGPYVTQVSDSSLNAITPANWQVKMFAFSPAPQTPLTEPACEVAVATPDSAVAWSNSLYVFNYGNASVKSYLSKIDRSNNNVTQLQTFGPGNSQALAISYVNPALFRFGSDNVDRIVFTSNRGLFTWQLNPVTPPSVLAKFGAVDLGRYKPIWVDESTYTTIVPAPPDASRSSEFPSFYLAGSGNDSASAGFNSKFIGGVLYYWNGSTYLKASSWPKAATGLTPTLSLHVVGAGGIANGALFTAYHSVNAALILLFQYNPIKRRIYVVTNECGYLFIYNLSLFSSNDITAWWNQPDATRYPQLTLEKVVAIAGGGAAWFPNGLRDRINVEYDTDTGDELSVCYTRVNNTSFLGSVTRAPWRE